MANVDRPAGLQPVRHLTGGMPNRLSRYHIEPELAANLFRGDAVIPTATHKRITTPGNDNVRLQGVFQGCTFILPDGEPKYEKVWRSGQKVQTGSTPDAFVYDDPKTLFMVQCDGAFALADIGAFANLTRGTGNALTGLSGHELQSASIGSGANLKIYDYVRTPDNEVGDHAKVIVLIVLHYLGGAATAI